MMMPEREIKASANEALEFLTTYAVRLGGALQGHIRMAEKRLNELTLEGAEKFGPDDLDYMVSVHRTAMLEAQAAMADLERLAPFKDMPIEDTAHMLGITDRLFPDAPSEDR